MTTKQIIFTVILIIINNSIFSMEKLSIDKPKNTLKRPYGYWSSQEKTLLTKASHQREDWYQDTKYIAEPWCTISNAGFFIAANSIKDSHPLSAAAITFAGSVSAISHAIPYHSLNVIDRIGAWSALAAVAYDAQMYKFAALSATLKNPIILTSLAATGFTVLTDHYIAHSEEFVEKSNGFIPQTMIVERKGAHKWIHVLWHILAAWTAYAVLTNS